MPRPLFERDVAEEEHKPTAERVETTERRDVAVVEVPRWLLIVAEHALPEALAAVVKSAAERGLLSLDERAAALEVALALYRGVERRALVGKSPRVVAAAVIYAATCTPAAAEALGVSPISVKETMRKLKLPVEMCVGHGAKPVEVYA